MCLLLMGFMVDNVIGGSPVALPAFLARAFGWIADTALLRERLWIVPGVLIALSMVQATAMFIRGRSTAKASETAVLTLRNRLYRHLSRLSYNYRPRKKSPPKAASAE